MQRRGSLTPSVSDPCALVLRRDGPLELALRCARTGRFAVLPPIALFAERQAAETFVAAAPPPAGLEWALLRHEGDAFRAAVRARLVPWPPQISIAALLKEGAAGGGAQPVTCCAVCSPGAADGRLFVPGPAPAGRRLTV